MRSKAWLFYAFQYLRDELPVDSNGGTLPKVEDHSVVLCRAEISRLLKPILTPVTSRTPNGRNGSLSASSLISSSGIVQTCGSEAVEASGKQCSNFQYDKRYSGVSRERRICILRSAAL